MRILWVMQHAGFIRYFESAIEVLASRGHQVVVALEEPRNKLDERLAADALAARVPTLGLREIPPIESAQAHALARSVRAVRDCLRYQTPEYDAAPEMRERSERFVPPSVLAFVHLARRLGGWAVDALDRVCARIDMATPPPAGTGAFIRAVAPDVVVATPYVNFGSDQAEFLREASALRIPTAAAIASWDNLTTKGRMAWVPARVIVWNRAQTAEAARLHGVPEDRVRACGASVFDHWFGWTPSRSRAEFCEMLGFDAARPIVLYLGSSQFLAPREAEFVGEWLATLRQSTDPRLASASVLVRPHPTNFRPWNSAGLEQIEGVSVWPARPQHPSAEAFRRDFYDSLYYCAAIVGVNTSAQIEAAIMRRPVLGAPVVDQTRFGARTLHFAHLAGGSDPLLWTAPDWEGHLSQLASVLADGDIAVERSDRFVQRFVRPRGRHVAAGEAVADAIEHLALTARRTVSAEAAPRADAFVRVAAAVPGAVLVWLFDNLGVPLWKRIVRALFSAFVAVAAIGYRTGDLAGRVARDARSGIRRAWRDVAGFFTARNRERRRAGDQRKRRARVTDRRVRQARRLPAAVRPSWGRLQKQLLRRLRKTRVVLRAAAGRILRMLRAGRTRR